MLVLTRLEKFCDLRDPICHSTCTKRAYTNCASGGIAGSMEETMPAYEICYIDESGNLARAFSVRFDSELRAKILAHAMKPSDCHQLEVWDGNKLVYSRPEQNAEAHW